MSILNIEGMKAEQNRIDLRISKLSDIFIPFRAGFIKTLTDFATEALEKGIRGITQVKTITDNDNIIEISFTFNDIKLILISLNEALPTDEKVISGQINLAYKIFIYPAGPDDTEPHIEIGVIDNNNESFSYSMKWFREKDAKKIPVRMSTPTETGIKAANAFLNHLYSFNKSWNERPSLGGIRGKGSYSSNIGF